MKSRDISILDFYNNLQHEYFCAELRYKIYTKKTDKDYWLTIMHHKKNKINDISQRNKLKSIFNDNSEYQKVFDSVLCYGVPKFIYRDLHQKKKLENRDLYFYFQPGCDVKYLNLEGQIFLGKIDSYDLENGVITISNDLKITEVKIENVCRVI